ASPTASDANPTAVVPPAADADPTAPVSAEPTATVDRPTAAEAEPTASVTAAGGTPADGTTNTDDEPTAVDGPPVAPEQRRPPAPTSVMPTPVSPAGRAAVPLYGGPKPNNTRRNLLIGAVVALLLIGLVVIVPKLGGKDEDTPQADPTGAAATSAPAQTSAPAAPAPPTGAPSPTPSATPSADPNALPAGWKLHRDPAGFSLPLPDGWVRRSAGSDTVVFDQSNGPGELLVQWTNNPAKNAVKDWQEQEPNRRNFVNNYQLIGIKGCDFWKTCGDWEWLETRDGTRIHVRNRGFVTASNRGYALRWEIAEKDWQANLPNFDRIAKGFEPDRKD
ncbi:protein kinase, partial [Micromonospora acroterricola]